jgi:hypothetical protein
MLMLSSIPGTLQIITVLLSFRSWDSSVGIATRLGWIVRVQFLVGAYFSLLKVTKTDSGTHLTPYSTGTTTTTTTIIIITATNS